MRSARATLLLGLLLGLASLCGCSGSDGDGGSERTRGPRAPRTATTPGTEGSTPGTAEGAPVGTEASGSAQPIGQPRVVLEAPGREPVVVNVEVARTPAQTQRGLMYRRQMDPDAGMIFLFPRARQMTFWMHNTYIPLDMVFITSDMRVLGVVENATPETDDPREVEGISQFVLEVNAGYAREHGITAGTVVRFEGIPDVPGAAGSAAQDEEDEWEDEK